MVMNGVALLIPVAILIYLLIALLSYLLTFFHHRPIAVTRRHCVELMYLRWQFRN